MDLARQRGRIRSMPEEQEVPAGQGEEGGLVPGEEMAKCCYKELHHHQDQTGRTYSVTLQAQPPVDPEKKDDLQMTEAVAVGCGKGRSS